MEPQWHYEFGDFRLDPFQRMLALRSNGQRLPLVSRAFDLLEYLALHQGELLDKAALMKAVWPDTIVEENNLNQSIGAIRRVLGESPGENKFIVTVAGRGYRFVANVTKVDANSLGSESSQMAASSSSDPVTPTRDRNRQRFVAAGLLTLGLVGALVYYVLNHAPVVREQAIAVMPFENLSQDSQNAFFAEGVQGEILTLLSRIGTLRVIARSSTQRYTQPEIATRQVASDLNVTHLLRGSVQRAGAKVRVNVQLIDAVADKQLWAETYERDVADVFAVESEVAQAIADNLHAKLSGAERLELAARPTRNAEAYDAYLKGRAYSERLTRTEGDNLDAIAAFEEAVRLDPTFAVAWARLSRRHANLIAVSYDRSSARREAARHALDMALKLQPDLVETKLALAYYLFRVEADFDRAEQIMLDTHRTWPHNPDTAAGLAQLNREKGRYEASLVYYKETQALSPQSAYQHAIWCDDYLTMRQFSLALKTCDRALDLAHGDVGALIVKASIYQALGEFDNADALLSNVMPAPSDARALMVLSYQAVLQRRYDKVPATLQSYLANSTALGSWLSVNRRWLADLQRLSGNGDAAKITYVQARDEALNELERQPENAPITSNLALVYAALGDRTNAMKFAEQAIILSKKSRRDTLISRSEEALARVEARFGLNDMAIARLQRLLKMTGGFPPVTTAILRRDPDWDSLRGDPRFQLLLDGQDSR